MEIVTGVILLLQVVILIQIMLMRKRMLQRLEVLQKKLSFVIEPVDKETSEDGETVIIKEMQQLSGDDKENCAQKLRGSLPEKESPEALINEVLSEVFS